MRQRYHILEVVWGVASWFGQLCGQKSLKSKKYFPPEWWPRWLDYGQKHATHGWEKNSIHFSINNLPLLASGAQRIRVGAGEHARGGDGARWRAAFPHARLKCHGGWAETAVHWTLDTDQAPPQPPALVLQVHHPVAQPHVSLFQGEVLADH